MTDEQKRITALEARLAAAEARVAVLEGREAKEARRLPSHVSGVPITEFLYGSFSVSGGHRPGIFNGGGTEAERDYWINRMGWGEPSAPVSVDKLGGLIKGEDE